MKELIMIWFKSLAMSAFAAIFSWQLFWSFLDSSAVVMFCALLPIFISVLSIVMVFKTKVGFWKKIITVFLLPSNIYLLYVILIILYVIIPWATKGFGPLGN